MEGKIRVQLNLRVQQAPYITPVKDFKTIVFPIMWLEEVSTKVILKNFSEKNPSETLR